MPSDHMFTTSGFRRVDSGRIIESRATKRAHRRARRERWLLAESVMLGMAVAFCAWGLTAVAPRILQLAIGLWRAI